MANNFPPIPDSCHLANLSYIVSTTQVSDASNQGLTGLPPITVYDAGFDTGTDDSGNTTFSYADFDQDTLEGQLADWLDAWCAFGVAALGVTTEQMQAAVTVARVWSVEVTAPFPSTFTPPITSFTTVDTMTYPAA